MPRLSKRQLLSAGAVSALALSGCTDVQSRLPIVGTAAIDDIVDENGQPVTLERVDTDDTDEYPVIDTEKDLTLLYFFATWCEPCGPQNEELAAVESEFDDVAMCAISPENDADLVGEYWTDSPSSFPALIDPDALVMEYYSVSSYPSLVLVDPNGEVLWEPGDEVETRAIGPVSADIVREKFEHHL